MGRSVKYGSRDEITGEQWTNFDCNVRAPKVRGVPDI